MENRSKTEPTRDDAAALAEAFIKRMRWPSMHWRTQSLDYDAAFALAIVALDHAPNLIAAARIKEQAMARVIVAAEAEVSA